MLKKMQRRLRETDVGSSPRLKVVRPKVPTFDFKMSSDGVERSE